MGTRYELQAPYTGMIMDKRDDGVQHYVYKWTHKLMTTWAYQAQFNYLVSGDPNRAAIFSNRRWHGRWHGSAKT
jgi:hypothetical protein